MHGTTTTTTFEALPANARIWVFAADHAFGEDETATLTALMNKVMEKWVIKQADIRGCWEFRDDRFLIVGADETRIGLDGCSVDAMMSFIMRLEAQTGLSLVDRMLLHYRDADGVVQSVPRHEFVQKAKTGDITPDTPVFDTTVSRIEALRGGRFELPLSESWHAKIV